MSISSVLSTLILWGRGAKHARCFFKVFGYYVHLLSKNIAGLAVHGGNGAVTICWFLFFVLLSSLQALGGWRRTQADLVVGCFMVQSAHGLKDKRIRTKPLRRDLDGHRDRNKKGTDNSPIVPPSSSPTPPPSSLPSLPAGVCICIIICFYAWKDASIDVCVFCSCSHSIP